MVETADLAFAVSLHASTAHIQIMQRNMRRSEDQGEHQHQSDKTVPFGVLMECFGQRPVIFP